MRSAWIISELWTMALNNMHPCRFSLKLFVVTFVLTYTFYTFHFLSARTSSKSGIISRTSRCYQGSRIIGKDKTKTEIWEDKPFTQRMLLFHPSAVPHLSRLQPPFGSASSQAILLHLKAPGQPEGIPNECFSSWNRKRHWDTTLRYIINLTWENRRKSSCFRWPNGTRSFQQKCTL